tara:strand:+ start:2970 stop:3704 length:735 start_codon:yes stop_codon:yes gene_type:complete
LNNSVNKKRHTFNGSFFIQKKKTNTVKKQKDLLNLKSFNIQNISNQTKYFCEIFKKEKNIAIWERTLDENLIKSGQFFINKKPFFEFSQIVKKETIEEKLISKLGSDEEIIELIRDIKLLVIEFCDLFNLKQAWLRLDSINKPMCPKFHTDDVVCRMVTTYIGPGTQWIPQEIVNKKIEKTDIMQLDIGHVGLLKGESWKGNQGKGLVHRSPHDSNNYKRLYLTLDFVEFYSKLNNNKLNNKIS